MKSAAAAYQSPNEFSNGGAYGHYHIVGQCQKYLKDYKVDDYRKQVGEYIWGIHNIRRMARPNENDYVANIVYKDFVLTKSMLLRDRPSFKLIPLSDQFSPQADILTGLIENIHAANNLMVELDVVVSHGLPFNHGFMKVGFDGAMRMGLGDISLTGMDSRNCLFMPGVFRIGRSLIFTERQQVDKVTALHMYGKDKKNRQAILSMFKKSHPKPDAPTEMMWDDNERMNVVVEGEFTRMSTAHQRSDDVPTIDIWQQWVLDPTVIKDIDELYGELKNNKAYKSLSPDQKEELLNTKAYPKGKVCIFAEDHLLESRLNPFPKLPYIHFMANQMPHMRPGDELRGGEYDQMLELQDLINEQLNLNKNKNDAAGTRTFAIGFDEAELEEWAGDPNSLVPSKTGQDAKGVTTPGMSGEMRVFFNDLFILAREVQNRSDISQGQNPSGARSGEQVVELSELANRVMVTRNHSLESFLAEMVRYEIDMIGAGFYRKGVHYKSEIDLTGVSSDLFQVVVTAGLNLPATESQKLVWLRSLRESGAIDPMALLEATPETILPNKNAVIERMKRIWEQQAQAAQQQQGAAVNTEAAKAQELRTRAQSNVVPIQGAAA